jgi:PPOX class probable F420-dependent enzyme
VPVTSTDGRPTLLTASGRATLVTIKRDGRPQLSIVGYAYDAAAGLVLMSLVAATAKTRNLCRDPRAGLYLTTADLGSYQVVEGTVALTPVAMEPEDATADALVEFYRLVAGREHLDWARYRAGVVARGRLVARFAIERDYGGDGTHASS